MLYCFVDTNILLECKMFDEIDWCTELNNDQVTLVVSFTVTRELDKIKVDPRYGRKRDRARKLLAKLENLLQPSVATPVRSGVYMLIIPSPSSEELKELHYDPTVADDQIVASAHIFSKQRPDTDVVVLAEDGTVRMKAKMNGLRFAEPSEVIRLPAETDSQEKELNELRAELNRLKNAQPKLNAGFQTEEGLVQILELALNFSFQRITQDEVERAIVARGMKLGLLDDSSQEAIDISKLVEKFDEMSMVQIMNLEATAYPEVQAAIEAKYQESLKTYLDKYSKYLIEDNLKRIYDYRTCTVQFALSNVGSAPADDVDVKLHFPNGLEVSNKQIHGDPSEPIVPTKPTVPDLLLGDMSRNIAPNLSPLFYLPDYSQNRPSPAPSPRIRKTNSYEVTFHTARIKQHHAWTWPLIWITFNPEKLPTAFEIDYDITVANKPDVVKGQLVIKLSNSPDLAM